LKRIEQRTVRKEINYVIRKEEIAKRIAKEVKDGYYVNLGIGIQH
jgi:acyl CoA:acetate/3-ketoacid CoA transferase beta subunit